jgi:hypothetical protein
MVAFSKVLNIYKDYSRPKSSAWIFPFYFTSLLEDTCFQQAGSSTVEGTSQAVLGSSHQ